MLFPVGAIAVHPEVPFGLLSQVTVEQPVPFAGEAVRLAEPPTQMVVFPDADTDGSGTTVTLTGGLVKPELPQASLVTLK